MQIHYSLATGTTCTQNSYVLKDRKTTKCNLFQIYRIYFYYLSRMWQHNTPCLIFRYRHEYVIVR
jgi:hypothetical protein